jgi:hypothetical protein
MRRYDSTAPRALRFLTVTGLLALVLGLAACGDSGDDEPSSSGGVAMTDQATDTAATGESAKGDGAPAKSDTPSFTGDVEQARAGAVAVDDVYEGFGDAVDAGIAVADVPARDTLAKADDDESLTSVCDLMSEAAKRQTVVYAKRSSGIADVDWTCEKATALLLRRAGQAGGLKRSLRAEIVGVNVEGDRATASVRFGGKGPISTVELVKEDGEWKLAATPTGG